MRHGLEKKRLLELTLAVYKVTALFSKEKNRDELGQKIKDLADKILADLLLEKCNESRSRYIEEILGLFDWAEERNMADKRNFLVLRQEYGKILKIIPPERDLLSDNHRQEKILAAFNGKNDMIKIGDFVKFFPGINRRTVLRDIDKLCQTGVMVRNGVGRGVYYVKNVAKMS